MCRAASAEQLSTNQLYGVHTCIKRKSWQSYRPRWIDGFTLGAKLAYAFYKTTGSVRTQEKLFDHGFSLNDGLGLTSTLVAGGLPSKHAAQMPRRSGTEGV